MRKPPKEVHEEPTVASIWINRCLYAISSLVVMASILVIVYGIGMQYAVLQVNLAVLYILLIGSITLLGYVEVTNNSCQSN
jgi:hypothetical protein